MKFSHQLVVSSLAVLVLSACSSSAVERRQAQNNFSYLDSSFSETWKTPDDTKVQIYDDYLVPAGIFTGPIGSDVDIRPPQQILELIPGARYDTKRGEVTVWLLNESERDKVWQTALEMIASRDIQLLENSPQRIETDWVTWVSNDEERVIGTRYSMERFTSNNRFGFKVLIIDWREDGQVRTISQTNQQRYNTLMTNLVTSTYDQNLRAESTRKAQQLVKQIPVHMGTDRSGLPVIIARAPYNIFWQRMIDSLTRVGFDFEERNQSQGLIKAKYVAPDEEFWTSLGTEPLALEGKAYTFLLGDLGNRTSVNITDGAGKPVPETVLESVAPVLAALVAEE